MAGKVMTAVIDIAGSLNPNLKKSISKAEKQMGALKVGVAAAGAAFAAASVASGKYLLDLGDKFDAAQDGIRIGTGATGAALDSLMTDFDNVLKALPTSSENAALAVADLNTKLNLQGKELQDVSKKAIYLSENLGAGELSAVIDSSSKAFQSWNIDAAAMGDKMDYVFKVSQSTGAGYNSLMSNVQKYGATLRSLGYDFETSAALIGQMEKAGVNADEALAAMKKSLSVMAKEGINASDGFQQYYEKIFNATDATEAANVAAEIFGTKAGPEMAAAIRAGKLSAGELTAALMASGETIEGLAKETFDYKEHLQTMKNTMDVALRPLANTVFGSLGETMPYVQMLFDKLQPVVEQFGVVLPQVISGAVGSIGWLIDNWGMIKPVIIGVTGAVVAYKAVMLATTAVSKASVAATKLKALWEGKSKIQTVAMTIAEKAKIVAMNAGAIATKGVAAAQWVMNAAMNANPIGLVVAGITALIAAGVLLYKNWDAVKEKAASLWAGFTGLLGNMGAFGAAITGFAGGWSTSISGAITNIKGVFTGLIDFVKNVFTGNWAGAWDAVKSIFTNAFQGLTGIMKAPINGVIGLINGVISSINGVGFTVPEWVPLIGGKAFTVNIPKMPMFATGGIATGPSIVGEGGYPEYVITTDPKYKAQNIAYLHQAAAELGASRLIQTTAAPGGNVIPFPSERAQGDTIYGPIYASLPEPEGWFDKIVGTLLGAADGRGQREEKKASAGRPIQITFAPNITVSSGNSQDILAQIRAQFPEFVDIVRKAIEAEQEGAYAG